MNENYLKDSKLPEGDLKIEGHRLYLDKKCTKTFLNSGKNKGIIMRWWFVFETELLGIILIDHCLLSVYPS